MTVPGWIFMLVSVGFVIALTVFCFVLVLRKPASDRQRAERSAGDAARRQS